MLKFETHRTSNTIFHGRHGKLHRLNRPAYYYECPRYIVISYFKYGHQLSTNMVELDKPNIINHVGIKVNAPHINSIILTELSRRINYSSVDLRIDTALLNQL